MASLGYLLESATRDNLTAVANIDLIVQSADLVDTCAVRRVRQYVLETSC
jgi:hypothetical protein